MKRVETLSGKNLPRLAVAKPGWPPTLDNLLDGMTTENLHPEINTGSPVGNELGSSKWASEQAVADFTRVCDQTGLSEKLRED